MNRREYIWSSNFAYAIGLIATDGNLSSDGRHIIFTTKDLDLAESFKKALNLGAKISRKARVKQGEKKYFLIQFSEVRLYKFLLEIGLMPNKSKQLASLRIPPIFFLDFLRGCIDGDGNIQVFQHPESRWPQLRLSIVSASKEFIIWLRKKITKYSLMGFVTKRKDVYVLAYAKKESIVLLNLLYYPGFELALARKYERAKPFLRV